MEVLFYISCLFLLIGVYGGFVSIENDVAIVYLVTVLNTFILVCIMGVLVYG